MSFDKKSFSDIYTSLEKDCRDRTPELSDFEEGSVVRSLFESFSVELATLYEQMDLVYNSAFVDTATGVNLDKVVAVLGIKRNEPDYASGVVTFQRDPGSDTRIVILAGTMVSTRETEEEPRRSYITIEEGMMEHNKTEVNIKVRAIERGREMISGEETVSIVPKPITGIKSVINKKPIRFLGKERESDEALRDRAKRELLASGRASITSIENSLLSLSGVREVRVKEDFEYYKLTEESVRKITKDIEPTPAVITRLNSLLNQEFSLKSLFLEKLEEALTGTTSVTEEKKQIILRHALFLRPGIIEVYVDGLSSANYEEVKQKLNEVRAAGIFADLKPALLVNLSLLFRIEVDERVKGEELEEVERLVRDRIFAFIDKQKMGDPLIFTQLTKEILEVKGVKDLGDFKIYKFYEQANFARGWVTLTRAGGNEYTIKPFSILETAGGQRFQVTPRPLVEEGKSSWDISAADQSITLAVQAEITGRAGELIRVGKDVGWKEFQADNERFTVENSASILLNKELFLPTDKRVVTAVMERLEPDTVRVAAEQKPLNLKIQFSPGDREFTPGDTAPLAEEIQRDLVEPLSKSVGVLLKEKNEPGLEPEQRELGVKEIREVIAAVIDPGPGFLVSVKPFDEEFYREAYRIKPEFLEDLSLGSFFVYLYPLELEGSIKLIMPLSFKKKEKQNLANQVRRFLKDQLELLTPEEPFKLDWIKKLPSRFPDLEGVEWDFKNFVTVMQKDGHRILLDGRVEKDKVTVDPLEKLVLSGEKFIIETT